MKQNHKSDQTYDKSGQKLIPGQRIADYTGISVPRWREEDPKFKVTVSCTVIYILSYTQKQRLEDQAGHFELEASLSHIIL